MIQFYIESDNADVYNGARLWFESMYLKETEWYQYNTFTCFTNELVSIYTPGDYSLYRIVYDQVNDR